MQSSTLILVLAGMTVLGYRLGRRRSLGLAAAGGRHRLHSLPRHYGLLTAVWCGVPALMFIVAWTSFEPLVIHHLLVAALPDAMQGQSAAETGLLLNDVRNLAAGNALSRAVDPVMRTAADHYLALQHGSRLALSVLSIALGVLGGVIGWRQVRAATRARNRVEHTLQVLLMACAAIAILTTLGIVFSVLFESLQFLARVPIGEFLFGLRWSPQIALRADQVGSSGAFGAVPLFAGTALITAIAMSVSVPLGLLAAIYLAEYAERRVRDVAKPLLEILAGIPTVVYGFFAALSVAPALRATGERVGLEVASESALAAGLVMGVMIIPLVSSLSDDVINAVPQSLRDGSYALGATRAETIRRVLLPAALPGIVGAVLLAVSRAIGETMIVVMAAGLSARLSANPLDAVTTVTVQIVTLLVGDQEFDSAKTLAAFALGLLLFGVTLVLNIIALQIVRRYRERYE